jgi:alkanesulfonate monooxygenase SsuD/methylene tetrahydromethanopterin reductase-like flavin-dependent oxidoreductase (luciferase family)
MRFSNEMLYTPGPENVVPGVLRRAELLEELGFDSGVLGHHRFVSGNVSAVFTLLAAVAARTERLQMGPGILVLPAYHPLDVAEQLHTLDQISEGRAFLGVGAGYRDYELTPTGKDYSKRGEMMTESLEALHAVWSSEKASYHGEHYSFDDVSVAPRAVQRPHPQVIVGAKAPVATRRAGRLGDALFGGLVQTIDEYRPAMDAYREAAVAAGKQPKVWLQRSTCLVSSRDEAEELWLRPYLENRRGKLSMGVASAGLVDERLMSGGTLTLDDVAPGRALVGTAEDIIEEIKRIQELTDTETIVVGHHWCAGNEPLIEEQMRLFADEVLPAFR